MEVIYTQRSQHDEILFKMHHKFWTATDSQTYNNARNTSIPPGVLIFQIVFVNKFNLMEDILLLLFWEVSEGPVDVCEIQSGVIPYPVDR